MTLGGLALAVGILVDDATVAIENINSHLEQGKDARAGDPRRRRSRSRCPRSSRRSASASCSCRCSSSPASRATCSCRWPKRSCSRCSPRTCCRARWCRRWRSTCCRRTRTRTARRRARNPFVRLQRAVRARLRAAARRLPRRCSSACVDRRGVFAAVFLLRAASASLAAGPLGRPGLLPRGRQRPVQAAPARADRHAHRGDRGAVRSRRGRDPRDHPGARARQRSSTTSACRTAASTSRTATRRRSAPATPTSSSRSAEDHRPTDRLRPRSAADAAEASFPACTFSFIPADIVTQILNFGLPAPIDVQVVGRNIEANRAVRRRAGRRSWRRSRASSTCACSRRSTSRCCTSTSIARARRRLGLHAARRRNNLLISLSRQQPDDADVLAEPDDRRQLRGRDADAAVPHRLAAGPRQHPGDRRRPARAADARGAGVDDARRRTRRSCRTTTCSRSSTSSAPCRGATSAASRATSQPILDAAQKDAAARLADHRPRPGRDDDVVVRRPARRAWRSRSCSSTC